MPVANLTAWGMTRQMRIVLKYSPDIVVAALILLLAAPLMALIALLIRLSDGGPALYWQTRVGKWGRTFRFPKFRSMVFNADALRKDLRTANSHGDNGMIFKIKRDPRVLWSGRILRKTSLDELPQLWCILKGNMSLAGPCSALESEVASPLLADRRRLEVKLGLICLWQVSGHSAFPLQEQVRLDTAYIKRQSFTEDIKLLLKIIPAVITGHGAY